jgi:hypothetical protein
MTYHRRQPSKTLYLKVAPGSEGALKIVWSVNALLAQYEVSEGLNGAPAGVREQLERLVKAKLKGSPIGPILKDLARAGQKLYNELFKATDLPDQARKVKKWMATAQQPLFVNITVSTYTRIPWGLLYEGDSEALPEDADPADFRVFQGFWCLRYLITCLHQRITAINEVRPEFRVFSVVHRREYNKVRATLTPEEQTRLNELIATFGGEIDTSTDLYAQWKKAGAIDRILMFYCHADGTSLALSATDLVSTSDFGEKLDHADDWPDSVTLTFLNGCSTAVGQATKSFLEATGQRGFIGFVGTEAKVPNVYALKFGAEFLRCFFQTGWPLVNVMDAMWRLHWPLSAVYGLNGYSDVSVRSDTLATHWPVEAPRNFSQETIGTSSI